MKHAVTGITALSFAICLAVAAPAGARAIRSDANQFNGWKPCDASNLCATLPTGLTFNPVGADPAAAPSPFEVMGGLTEVVADQQGFGTDAQTPCIGNTGSSISGCSASGAATVPGIEYSYATPQGTAQVVFFDLAGNNTVYGPNSIGNPVALPSAPAGPAWEIEFNYNFTPSSTTFASLDLLGNIYTASGSTLSTGNLNEFVFYGDTLYKPDGWVRAPASAPEVDPTSAMAALTLLAGCLAVMRGRRQSPERPHP